MNAGHAAFCTVALMLCTAVAQAQIPQASIEQPTSARSAEGIWMPMPDLFPTGAEMQILHGNPVRGAADYYFRVPGSYSFPWHFHTTVERLFVDEGALTYESRGGHTQTVQSGDYVYVPARSPHRVTCASATPCSFFLASAGAFDIHLVDANWNTTRSWRPAPAPTSTPGRR